MKRFAAILLTASLLFSATSCAYISDKFSKLYAFDKNAESTVYLKHENESSSNTNESKHDSNVADFSSYEAIIETYKSIVSCFPKCKYEQYSNSECVYTLDIPDEETRTTYERLFFSAFDNYRYDYTVEYNQDGRNYFGYAVYDLNGNGSDELILLNDYYDIIAIFTNFRSKPRLIIDNADQCRIDSRGRIYVQSLVLEGDYMYHKITISTLSDSDELTVVEEYLSKSEFWAGENKLLYITNGANIEISTEEYIEKTGGWLNLSQAACATQASIDLDFVRLFDSIKPQISDIYSWSWYENKYITDHFIALCNSTDTTIDIAFYSDGTALTCEAHFTAEITGESIYFDSDKISGRLEFGLDCIWIVISESKIDSFPCGAYIYEYYEIKK